LSTLKKVPHCISMASRLAEELWEATPDLSARSFMSDKYLKYAAIFIRESILIRS
jgi:hypothetical protein